MNEIIKMRSIWCLINSIEFDLKCRLNYVMMQIINKKTQTHIQMIVQKYFSLAVFLMFLFTLETLQYNVMRFDRNQQIRYLQTNNQHQQYSDKLEDVYLAQKFPYKFGTVISEDSGNAQIGESKRRSFIIDARPYFTLDASQTLLQDQRINVVIKLLSRRDGGISGVIKQLQIEKQEWDKDRGQFKSTVLTTDKLTMDRHNQFYSFLLPTIQDGKYRVVIAWEVHENQHLNYFYIVYYRFNLLDGNFNAIAPMEPVDISTTGNETILPYGQTISVPISSPDDVMMVQMQLCSFQPVQILYSLNHTSQMQKLNYHDIQSTIFLISNHYTPYNPSIYLKYVQSPQVYLRIRSSSKSREKGNIVQNKQFQQYFVKINKNTKTHFKNLLSTNQQFSQSISYQIKGSDLEITYKRLNPNKNALIQVAQNPLSNAKIVYKLYLSSSQSALAKKLLCGMDTYQQGKNVIVMQKVIEEQSISDFIEKREQKQTFSSQSQEMGIAKISLWDIRESFQNADSELYVNMKVSITVQNISISSQISGSQKLSSEKVDANNEVFYYQPMKVNLISSDIWLFLRDIKFSKLMWVFVIISLCILFVMFFFQSLCKGWISRKRIADESISPRIVIKKPKKSLSDSYGFNPSPPGSSNIIKIYETSRSDQIIEDGQGESKSEGKLKISNQLQSPTLV